VSARINLINQTVGEYRVVDFLGAGGMGEVYRAEHAKLGRVAAVKVLTAAAAGAGGFVERFFNEARIQASLQHPNIATLYDFLEVGGQPCIIMEYVDGLTLSDRVKSYGALPLAETVFIFQAVVEAIGYIHRHGIIHRDIKSNNIKISTTGQVKLLDFGIAKGQMSPGLTEVGSIIGTLFYLSPEQLKGGTADARGDIWALGVLLYEMVTGRMPFEAGTLGELCEKIDRAVYTPPTQLDSSVPREAANIIARCLRKNPAERYQTADELSHDVRKLSALVPPPGTGDGMNISPTLYSGDPSPSTRPKNLLWMAGAGSAFVILVLVFIGAFMLMNGSSEDRSANENGVVKGSRASVPVGDTSGAGGTVKSIELSVMEGRADVYRDGQLLGTTPHKLNARVGERITLTLKREGYKDEPVDFSVSESKRDYVFKMSK